MDLDLHDAATGFSNPDFSAYAKSFGARVFLHREAGGWSLPCAQQAHRVSE
jgi:hypothetical protein